MTHESPAPEPASADAAAPPEDCAIRSAYPNGHFYSPVVNPSELANEAERVWPERPSVLGIDFNDASHQHILREVFPRHMPEYDYPEHLEETPELTAFFTQNSQFSWLDARALFVLLREWKPQRVIEVGSGFSTLLMADVNRRFLDGRMRITCIEPYPRPFLHGELCGVQLLQQRVQDAALETFEDLQPGDVLFIDSSHVAKTGSDVNFLFLQVLPRLRPGARIHIHDIFLPHDYKRNWVIDENRSWNEQYLVQALLMYSTAFRVLFGNSYAFHRFPDLVQAALAHPEGRAYGGGSLWLERL